MDQDYDEDRETTLQAVRLSLRSKSLSRLKQAFERPWVQKVIFRYRDAEPTPAYRIFKAALKEMSAEDRKKAFHWTWDCYHPYMADLSKAIQDLDKIGQQRQL